MAVESVTITRENYGVSEGTWTGSRTYTVRFDTLTFDTADALSADDGTTAIPDVGDAWAAGKSGKAISKQASTGEDQLEVQVAVGYSSRSEDQQQTIENPLSRPTQYSYEDGEESEPYFRDTDDEPVVNSAGDDFQDLPQRAVSRGSITITRNVASYNDGTAEAFRNRVNSGNVTINGTTYTAGTLRVSGYSASGPNVENDITYWTETIRYAKNVNGWDDKFEDRGLNQLESGQPQPIHDAAGQPVVLPYPLDGSGAAKANITDAPAQITRKPYTAGALPA